MFNAIRNFKNFDLILNNISDMMFLMSLDEDGMFRYVSANKVAIEALQFPKNFAGKSIEELIPEQSAKMIIQQYQEAIKKKDTLTYEERMELPMEGDVFHEKWRWIESRVTPIFNDNGECEYIISVSRDMTERKNQEKELQLLKEQFEGIFNHVADPIFTFDDEGNYLTVNPSFSDTFGWSLEEVLIDPNISILVEKEDFNDILLLLKNGEVVKNHYAKRRAKNGDIIHVLSSYTPVMIDGEMKGGIAVYKDVTDIENLKKALLISEDRYKIIVENSNDLIRVTDVKGKIEYASPSHKEILGIDPEFFTGKSFISFVHREDMAAIENCITKIKATREDYEVEYRHLNKSGDMIWVHSQAVPVVNEKREVEQIVFVSRNISARKEKEFELTSKALYDELTGLPKRALFNEHLESAMKASNRKKKWTALLILDCDNFKSVNDTYGHSVGDEVIREFGRRIQGCIRDIDTASRMGGDEFQVVIPDLDKRSDARKICQRIIYSMKKPILVDSKKISISASIGVSYYRDLEKSKETLLEEADRALYASKNNGKGTFTEYSKMPDQKQKTSIMRRILKHGRK